MKNRRKALSVALASALLIPALTVTAFGSASELYAGYIKGNTILGEDQYLTDPAARDMYNDLIFVSGAPGSASASGYGNFYTMIDTRTGTYKYAFGTLPAVLGGDGGTYTADDVKPIGNIKWVLYDGVMIVTNDWTDAEVEAKINPNVDESTKNAARQTMTQMNFLNYEESYLELTPFRNNANIETIIIGDNIDYNWARSVFVNCPNIKNIICLDGMDKMLVANAHPEYVIVRETQTSGALPNGDPNMSAEKVAYQSNGHRGDFLEYTSGSKGTLNINVPTFTPNYGGQAGGTWSYPDAATVASQYATAKQYIADMDLPDWALAFIPEAMGGTGTARTVEDVFNFTTATLKSNWSNSTGTVTETPVTEPEAPVATTVTYSDWARSDIMNAGMAGYLDTLPASNAPAVTDLLGSDFTKPITRGQFAALAVRYYETLMSSLTETDYIIPVDTGDDVFADSTGNEAITKAYNLGLIGGYNSAPDRSGVSVGPNDLITREQAATMLTRLMEQLSDDFSEIGRTGWSVYRADNLPFTDTISDWALDGVKAMYGNGVMTGTSGTTFSPKGNYTIEQSIVTLMRIDGWANMGMGA